MSRAKLGIIGLVTFAVVAAAGAYAYHQASKVIVLRIATGPADGFGAQFSTALVHLVNLDHPRVRVRNTPMDSDADALKALDAGDVDVAIARSDAGVAQGLSVAVLRHDAAIFVIPHGSKADSIAGLHGATLGTVGTSPGDGKLLDAVRQEYGLPSAPTIPLDPAAVSDAIKTKKIQAVFVVGAPGGPTISRTLAAVRAGGGGPAKVVTIDESAAIVKKNHLLENVDLPKGAFQGSPPLPDDDATTLGISTRLFATSRMSDTVAAELTRILLTDKPRVASLMPRTALVEPPETDKLNASLPVHPGTAAYLTGNQPSLSDQTQNLLYWIGIIGSLFASMAAALAAAFRRFVPRKDDTAIKLLDLWLAARDAATETELIGYDKDVDTLVQAAIRKQAAGKQDELNPAFSLLMEQVKRAIDRRRAELAGRTVPPSILYQEAAPGP